MWRLLFTSLPLKHANQCGDESMFYQPRMPQLILLLDIVDGDTGQGVGDAEEAVLCLVRIPKQRKRSKHVHMFEKIE